MHTSGARAHASGPSWLPATTLVVKHRQRKRSKTMLPPYPSARQSLRRFALTVALLLGSFVALASTSGATASSHIALVDAGGSGGGGGAATAPAPFAATANGRSIQLTESKEPVVVTVAHMSPSQRSIALIEGRDPENAGIAFVISPPVTDGPDIAAGAQEVNFCRACDTLL
jgi:hypothetical protein